LSELAIDGAYGEGGGQLVRLAVALAAVTGRAIRLHDIRAHRSKPGLAAQHLTALRAVAAMCGGELTGATLGADEVRFRPGRIRGGDYRFDVGTAGSVALVLQAVLPVALQADAPSHLTITGGTDVRQAPTLDYLRWVFLPWLAQMGVQVQLLRWRRGYYPRGGGELAIEVHPCRQLRPLRAEVRGPLRTIAVHAHVARLPLGIAERMASAAQGVLADLAPLHIGTQVLAEGEASGTGGALTLVAETGQVRLGASVVAQRGVPAERLGLAAAESLRLDLESGAALDIHAADQLLVYAALAHGESRFSVRELTPHAHTVMWLIDQFLPVRLVLPAGQTCCRVLVTRS